MWNKRFTPQQILNQAYSDAWAMLTQNISWAIARGTVEWMSYINKFGSNSVASSTESLVWDKWTVYNFPTSASILDIQSTLASDTMTTWDWAWTILVQGLDWDYNEVSETLELDWTNTINTTNSYLRVFRMVILTAWADEKANWVITADIAWDTKAQIIDWNNQTLMTTYTIPAWKTWYLLQWKASTGQWKAVTFKFKARPLGWVFNLKHTFDIYETNYGYQYPMPLQLPAKTDIMVTAQVATWTASVSAVFDIVLIDD